MLQERLRERATRLRARLTHLCDPRAPPAGGNYVPQWTAAVLGGSDTRLIKQLKGFSVNNPVFSLPPTADGVNRTFANIKSLVLGEIMYGNKLAPRWAYEQFVAAGCESFEPTPYCDGLRDQLVRFGGDCYLGNACGDNMWIAPSGNGSLGVETVTVNDVDVAWDTYLSRADVQAAIHAKPPHGGGAWVQCGGIGYDVTWPSSLIPYGAAFAAGLKVLVFSGDGDATTCPFSGTQVAIMALQELPGAAITKNWTAWSVNGQTAGYIERHGAAFTFATVKGAGHEAVSAQDHSHACSRPRVTRIRARIPDSQAALLLATLFVPLCRRAVRPQELLPRLPQRASRAGEPALPALQETCVLAQRLRACGNALA